MTLASPITVAAVERCIRDYIAAWNARDFQAMAASFTEPAVFVLASGTRVLASREALQAFLREVFAGLEAAGFDHTEIGAISVRCCAEGLVQAEVADINRYHRSGRLMETIEVQYTLRHDADGRLRMVSALWCQPGWRVIERL
jgi:uncharacterized protein (TIGR02246 family)